MARTMSGPISPETESLTAGLPQASLRQIVVSGNGMLPLYRHGDYLLVAGTESAKCGDRVVVEGDDFGIIAGTLIHYGQDQIVVAKGGQPSRSLRVDLAAAKFFGRVIWASQ
jgi:phage repressor protein C with HTH and peptisase S24 domain